MFRPGRLLLLAGLIGALCVAFLIGAWRGPGPATAPVQIRIEQGATLTSAARTLRKAGAIRSGTLFARLAPILGGGKPIQAGEYEIPAHASPAEILARLQSGKTIQHLITIPEGMPSILVHERLMAEPLLTGTIAVPEEGSVLPDSYAFGNGEARAAVLARMQAAMTAALDDAWAKRTPAAVVSSKRDALILASIVEKETGIASERRTVAAVYSNRLRTGMRLQADPTTIYPITKGKPLGRRIRRSELEAVNGYNTYSMAGLPRGPIANPSRAAIEAVLDPAESQALYFVADGKGGHVFARTLAEHQANVERYYALRRQRGEM
jgi:UPF0755 protein